MNIFVFDIETIPDIEYGRRLYNLGGLTDEEVVQALYRLRRQETNGASEFLRFHLHKIVAISVILRSRDQLKVWSLGDSQASEKELVERFFAGIDKYSPSLVSWNGGGFDLPVLHYRALLHGISAPRYWETGDEEQAFRWNNYLNRFHYRHMDLMDILSGYQSRAVAPLDEIALLLGLPGKMGLSGALVWDYYQRGEIEQIRNYCETDVLNTYLVYLRFELMRGKLDKQRYTYECNFLIQYLQNQNKLHLKTFLQTWQDNQPNDEELKWAS